MSVVKHDVVVVTGSGHAEAPDLDAFRDSMPEELRVLVQGPFPAPENWYSTWLFLPDGSGERWDTSDAADEWRSRFIKLFEDAVDVDGSSAFDLVWVSFGGDLRKRDEAPRIEYGFPLPMME